MPRGQAPYPPEFRAEAVRLAREPGHSIGEVARDLGIGCTLGCSDPSGSATNDRRRNWPLDDYRSFNAMAESFFASLETELIDRTVWRTHHEACLAVFDWIEVFYDRVRRHSALGYRSPVDYEESHRPITLVAA